MNFKQALTYKIYERDTNIVDCVTALVREATQLKNNAIFILRQLISAKTAINLHDNQKFAIHLYDQAVVELGVRWANTDKRIPELFAYAPLSQFASLKFNKAILGIILPDYIYADQKYASYRCLPGQMAQQAIGEVIESFKAWYKANKDYAKHPHKYTGRPEMPKYVDTTGVTFPAQNLLNTNDKTIRRFTKLNKLELGLSDGNASEWMKYDLKAACNRAKRHRAIDGKFAEVRLSLKNSVVQMAFVFNTNVTVSDTSAVALHKAEQSLDHFNFAGGDPGQTNSQMTFAFSNGHQPILINAGSMLNQV